MTNIDLVHHAVVLWRRGGPGRRKQASIHSEKRRAKFRGNYVPVKKISTCADDLRVSTASGSERSFRKGLIDGATLATARGTDPSPSEKISTCADDLRVSTASGSERSFRKGLIDGATLATARGTGPSPSESLI